MTSDPPLRLKRRVVRGCANSRGCDVKALALRFETAGVKFDASGESSSSCRGLGRHIPPTTITLRRGSRRLEIERYWCDDKPRTLLDEIERVTRLERWTRCEPGPCVPCRDVEEGKL
jgi:hypothetical protein